MVRRYKIKERIVEEKGKVSDQKAMEKKHLKL